MRVNNHTDPDDDRQDREHERDEQPPVMLAVLDGRGHADECRRSTPATGDFGSISARRWPAAGQQRKKNLAGARWPLFALVCA